MLFIKFKICQYENRKTTYKQRSSLKSYKTEIKILANPGLAYRPLNYPVDHYPVDNVVHPPNGGS